MIEIVCKDRLQEEEGKVCLPKNIRQIGSPRGRHKIYIEDYVYTYLRNMAQKKESCAAIFLGKGQIVKDIRYTFISGAIECGSLVFQWDSICLDDSFWKCIEEEKKQYFPEKEMVGWFLGKTGQAMELTSVVEAAHRKYFSGRDKVLMLMDILEEEEVFFIYDQGYLQKREGYYIYYEKNLPMQEYMIQKREEISGEDRPWIEETQQGERSAQRKEVCQEVSDQTEMVLQSEETGQGNPEDRKQQEPGSETGKDQEVNLGAEAGKDQEAEPGAGSQEKIFAKSNLEEPKTQAEEALESYRHMILERQGRQAERQNRKFLYTASSFFLVAVCVLGITTINNYRKMQEVEDVLHVMSHKESQENRSQEEGPVVESVMSQVDPLEKDGETPSSPEAAQGTDKPEESSMETGQAAEVPGETVQGTDKPTENSGQASQPAESASEAGEGADKPAENAGETEQDAENAGAGNSSEESAETSAAQSQETRYYTVKPGDTLGSICISVYHDQRMMAKVCEANGIENGDKIYVGQRLLLP